MGRIGYALSSEEYPPAELLRQARLADAGFAAYIARELVRAARAAPVGARA